MRVVPPVATSRLAPDEAVRWMQGPEKRAWLGPVWVVVGMSIGIYYMGGAPDIPGRFSWVGSALQSMLPFELGELPAWALPIAAVASIVSFLWLGVRHAIQENLSTWVVTDRRILRVVPLLPWLDVEHALAGVAVERSRPKDSGGVVKLRVQGKDGAETIRIRAREGYDALLAAIGPAR